MGALTTSSADLAHLTSSARLTSFVPRMLGYTSSAAAGNKLNKRATSVDATSGQGRGCSEITGSKQIQGHVGERVQAEIK